MFCISLDGSQVRRAVSDGVENRLRDRIGLLRQAIVNPQTATFSRNDSRSSQVRQMA